MPRQARPFVSSATIVATIMALLIVMSVGLTSCGASGSDADTTAGDTAASATADDETTTTKVERLTLVAPPGPMAIPVAYIAANDKLADVAQETEVVIWENADQLKAILAGGQGDFITVPSNNAATFYNKGVQLKLLDISVWNITYLISSDPAAKSFTGIKGQSLVVPFQGSAPDVMFRYIAAHEGTEGLDPDKDCDLRYATDSVEAAQLLLASQVKNAVLSEPLATSVVLQSKDTPTPLYRAMAFDLGWLAATGVATSDTLAPGGDSPLAHTPIAGVVATATVLDKPEIIAAFEHEYAAAVDWLLTNPEAAGELLETELPQLGVKAAVMTASLKSITWQHQTAQEAKARLEAFYTALMDLSPAVIGGMLPDDDFYYSE